MPTYFCYVKVLWAKHGEKDRLVLMIHRHEDGIVTKDIGGCRNCPPIERTEEGSIEEVQEV